MRIFFCMALLAATSFSLQGQDNYKYNVGLIASGAEQLDLAGSYLFEKNNSFLRLRTINLLGFIADSDFSSDNKNYKVGFGVSYLKRGKQEAFYLFHGIDAGVSFSAIATTVNSFNFSNINLRKEQNIHIGYSVGIGSVILKKIRLQIELLPLIGGYLSYGNSENISSSQFNFPFKDGADSLLKFSLAYQLKSRKKIAQ